MFNKCNQTVTCSELKPFQTTSEATVHRPVIGEKLILSCQPPYSNPKANIYWGINKPGYNHPKSIDNNDRVMLGYDGKKYCHC